MRHIKYAVVMIIAAFLVMLCSLPPFPSQKPFPMWVGAKVDGAGAYWQAAPGSVQGNLEYRNRVGQSTLRVTFREWQHWEGNVSLCLDVSAEKDTMIFLHPGASLVKEGGRVSPVDRIEATLLAGGEEAQIYIKARPTEGHGVHDLITEGGFRQASLSEAWNLK